MLVLSAPLTDHIRFAIFEIKIDPVDPLLSPLGRSLILSWEITESSVGCYSNMTSEENIEVLGTLILV